MRKLLISISFFLISVYGFAQIPVTDALAVAALEQIALQDEIMQFSNYTEYMDQSSSLYQTLQVIKDAREILSKISSVVTQVVWYEDIITVQLTIISSEIDYIKALNDDENITFDELSIASTMFGDILTRSETLLSMALDLVTQGDVEMESSQRIQLLKEIADEMSGLFTQMLILNHNYTYLSRERELNNILNNW
jgi:hypothetical protein